MANTQHKTINRQQTQIIQILELADNDFQAAVTDMLSEAKKNIFIINESWENLADKHK